jgi:hypothetical protein
MANVARSSYAVGFFFCHVPVPAAAQRKTAALTWVLVLIFLHGGVVTVDRYPTMFLSEAACFTAANQMVGANVGYDRIVVPLCEQEWSNRDR